MDVEYQGYDLQIPEGEEEDPYRPWFPSIPKSRQPVNVVQFLRLEGMLNGQKMSDWELFRGDLLISQMRENASAILHARSEGGEVFIEIPKRRQMAQHFSEGVGFPSQAAFYHLAGKFGRPSDNTTWAL